MIVSFHPCFVGDANHICAGRPPGDTDLAAIRAADAVVLPQGCSRQLFDMARANCRHVFPDYETKFRYPGKIGQTRLFRKLRVQHPKTVTFETCEAFFSRCPDWQKHPPLAYPLVFKLDWGGEGEAVTLIRSSDDLSAALDHAHRCELSGQNGFLLQNFIPGQSRTLRITVIGTRFISYWRVQPDGGRFIVNLADGGIVDHDSDPDLQQVAKTTVRDFCRKTGINLAGFDMLFSPDGTPLFLEINYFFGRRGLGGSQAYYRMLITEIERWIGSLDRRS